MGKLIKKLKKHAYETHKKKTYTLTCRSYKLLIDNTAQQKNFFFFLPKIF